MPRKARRSVEKDVKRFVGYDKLLEMASKIRSARYQAFFATAFLTGGRVSEVLALMKENFVVGKRLVMVLNMPLLKRFEKEEEFIEWVDSPPQNVLRKFYHLDNQSGRYWRKRYKTKPVYETRRDFGFKKDEPLCSCLLHWLNQIKTGPLFPQMSRFQVYHALENVGIYPHWLRAQRASCLISFWGFTMEGMMEWMSWEELSTAQRYARMGPQLMEKFEEKEIPRHLKQIEGKIFANI